MFNILITVKFWSNSHSFPLQFPYISLPIPQKLIGGAFFSKIRIFGNEVNDIIRDLVNINKEIIESIPSIPSPIKQVHKVNEEINNKKEFFEKWKEFVKINKLKRKYFQKWRKLVEKKIEERHKVNEDINKKQMSYFKNLIKSSKNGDSRTKNTIQTYGYDWRNAIKNFYPNRNLNIKFRMD